MSRNRSCRFFQSGPTLPMAVGTTAAIGAFAAMKIAQSEGALDFGDMNSYAADAIMAAVELGLFTAAASGVYALRWAWHCLTQSGNQNVNERTPINQTRDEETGLNPQVSAQIDETDIEEVSAEIQRPRSPGGR